LIHKGAHFTSISDYAGSPKPTIGVSRTHSERMKQNLINVMQKKEHLQVKHSHFVKQSMGKEFLHDRKAERFFKSE